jgi:hypothetical protein
VLFLSFYILVSECEEIMQIQRLGYANNLQNRPSFKGIRPEAVNFLHQQSKCNIAQVASAGASQGMIEQLYQNASKFINDLVEKQKDNKTVDVTVNNWNSKLVLVNAKTDKKLCLFENGFLGTNFDGLGDKISEQTKMLEEKSLRNAHLAKDTPALANALIADIHTGLFKSSKDIDEHIALINSKNIFEIFDKYAENAPISGNEKESLISGIISKSTLPKEDRIKYLTHIKSALLDATKDAGVKYVDDISTSFDKEVKYQMNKFGFANSDFLDTNLNKLQRRTRAELKFDRPFVPPNGKVDNDFKQGATGDCWLLSSIKALANNEIGRKILDDSLKLDENGNTIVTLKGVGKSYTITPEELKGNVQLSSGDGDVRAIEIAVDKYFYEERGVNGSLDINGNNPTIAFSMLTGQGASNVAQQFAGYAEARFSDSQIDNFNNPKHIAVVSSQKDIKKTTYEDPITKKEGTLYCMHAYAVKGSDKDNVYVINPWDSEKIDSVPRKKFKEFFYRVYEFDLNDVEMPKK